MRLENKTAIITGAGSGIGLSCARTFVREGAQVALFGRRTERLEEAQKELGDAALAVPGNMNRTEDLDRLVQSTLDAFGKIDILVHNAGVFTGDPLHAMEDAKWDLVQNTNIRSVFQLTKRVLPDMMNRTSGTFIHISSILGLIAVPQMGAYNVSKGALIQLSRSLAVEYGAYGIRSNAVCPGMIETEMTENLRSDEALMKEWIKDYPLGRFGKPEEVASACLFLAGEESAFITGAVLPVDGGFTAH